MFNEWTDLAQAVRLGGWALYPLSVLAVAALAITLDRAWALWRLSSMSAVDARLRDSYDVAGLLEHLPPRHALARMGRAILEAHGAPQSRIEAKVQAVATHIQREMGRGLWLLETIVTAAPLVGLLGTIVGMMHAFKLIGGDGLVNPAGVTGGVAQALVATAIGLVIALVALFAFNFFSRRIEQLTDELESFANLLLAEQQAAHETCNLEAMTA